MKAIFATTFYLVLIGTNMGNLQGSGGELLTFIRYHVATKWVSSTFHLLPLQVKDVDLGIRHTSAKVRL
jgi:hypothetical protein